MDSTIEITRATVNEAVGRVIDCLNTIEKISHAEQGFTHTADFWHASERRKFHALDCGNSGAFLVDVVNGELFNISGYGRPDYNKKKKADLGNVLTVNAETLHGKRWNYLR
ncbi:MAG: hypothetical protein Q7R68_10835 [Nitrospirales bacterium]|nr:hypothetical protein [Nitrospirales bacterium]